MISLRIRLDKPPVRKSGAETALILTSYSAPGQMVDCSTQLGRADEPLVDEFIVGILVCEVTPLFGLFKKKRDGGGGELQGISTHLNVMGYDLTPYGTGVAQLGLMNGYNQVERRLTLLLQPWP